MRQTIHNARPCCHWTKATRGVWRCRRYALCALWILTSASPTLAQSIHGAPASIRVAILYGDGIVAEVSSVPRPAETGRLRLALKERPTDRWLGRDKAQHAAFGFLWTLSSQYTLVNKLDVSERGALPFSVGSGVLLGLSKELYDASQAPRNYFSYRDLVADALGIALALGLILL